MFTAKPGFYGLRQKSWRPPPLPWSYTKVWHSFRNLNSEAIFCPHFHKKIPMIKVRNLNLNLADFWKKYLFIISCYKFMKFINYIIWSHLSVSLVVGMPLLCDVVNLLLDCVIWECLQQSLGFIQCINAASIYNAGNHSISVCCLEFGSGDQLVKSLFPHYNDVASCPGLHSPVT